MSSVADPGYGDPLAPVGSPEWAKRWRLVFQTAVKELPRSPKVNAEFYELGEKHHAWSLLTDEKGRHFKTWAAFCSYRQPYGLGTDPAEFRKYVEPAMGGRAFDLMTVAPGTDKGGHHSLYKDDAGDIVSPASPAEEKKAKRLRAILRAPEVIQELYREGLIPQTIAAKMGPKSPTPELAARLAETRQEIEKLPRPDVAETLFDAAKVEKAKREFRAGVKRIVSGRLGGGKTRLDRLRDLWAEATEEERAEFLKEVT